MGGQLDGNFLPGSLPHEFILIVILIICFVVNKFISLSSAKCNNGSRDLYHAPFMDDLSAD